MFTSARVASPDFKNKKNAKRMKFIFDFISVFFGSGKKISLVASLGSVGLGLNSGLAMFWSFKKKRVAAQPKQRGAEF